MSHRFRVVFYCPDRHLLYHGRTPDDQGVGGGLTSRIRMARALAANGHEVTLVGNVEREGWVDGVYHLPLDRVTHITGDVLILNTSGGAYDLSPIRSVHLDVALSLLWVSGTAPPGGLSRVRWDWVYAKSNFLRDVVVQDWGVSPEVVFVTYNGFDAKVFQQEEMRPPPRDPFRLMYFSHPSKGLEAAVALVRSLRQRDPRYRLEVFGGNRLWGQEEEPFEPVDGVRYHGLVGQRCIVRELLASGYALALQSREEPFGLAVLEAMRAGCVVLASAVGAYPELIRHGVDGFLLSGKPESSGVQEAARDLILALNARPELRLSVERAARTVPWDTDLIARTWAAHWHWCLERARPRGEEGYARTCCPRCGGPALRLLDGDHCLQCGRFHAVRRGVEGALTGPSRSQRGRPGDP